MNSKTSRIGLLFLVVCVLGIATLVSRPPVPATTVKVTMLNVGQGDSFFIEAANGHQLLIDGGKDATVLGELAKVMKWNDKYIDIVLATHPDADHIGGLQSVVERYAVGLFLTSDVVGDSDMYKALLETVHTKDIPAYFVRRGMNLVLDEALPTNFKILFPDRDTHLWETNTASVVGKLTIGKRSMLLTGDSPISVEQSLVKTIPAELNVDILKLGHHGSKTSTSPEYLKATSPALALISAGVGNSYGHPHPDVTARLDAYHIPWLSTQTEGTVMFETDGEKWYRK